MTALSIAELERQAEAGNATQKFNMGVRYYNGEGVEANPTKALRWYQKAAEQGDVEAQALLGASYFLGKGVTQNYPRSYFWLSIAAAQGDDKAMGVRDTVAKELSPDEIMRVQKLATQCLESDFQTYPQP